MDCRVKRGNDNGESEVVEGEAAANRQHPHH
jgi:hypothetical protein